MIIIGFFWLVALLLLARWLYPSEAARALPEQARRMEAELERLREEVDHLSGQVERLLEEQSFLVRVLNEGDRPQALRAPPNEPQPGDPHGDTRGR